MAVRNWADGETLTADVMNELVSSTTMRFASAAARDAAMVEGLAPVEGMTVFLLDSNLVFKYIVVGGAGYWAPQAGTLCFYAYQKTSQTLPSSTETVVAPMDGIVGNRNLNNWYDPVTARFTPGCPGHYQFFGGAGINCTNTLGVYRVGLWPGTFILPASKREYPHGNIASVGAFGFKDQIVYMNGTTDSMRMGAMSPPGDTTAISYSYAASSAFGAVYLGM